VSQGEIVDKVVTYVVSEIVDDTDAVEVNVVSDGDDAVVADDSVELPEQLLVDLETAL